MPGNVDDGDATDSAAEIEGREVEAIVGELIESTQAPR